MRIELNSDSKLLDFIEKRCSSFEDPWVLVHSHSQILLEKLKTPTEKLKNITLKELKEVRVFTENAELKIWYYGDSFHFRLFTESDENDYEEPYIEKMALWGTDVFDGILTEEGRGCQIQIPPECTVEKSELPLILTTLNYYNYTSEKNPPEGLLEFKDARLRSIETSAGREL